MAVEKPFRVVQLESLGWPASVQIPGGRFRLFVVADVTRQSTERLSEFAHSALKSGMVYFCAWGTDCERFHDIVDELVVEDHMGPRLFVGNSRSDAIMTISHGGEPLNEALDFFANLSCPTAGFERNSNFWLAVCLNNAEWAAEIQRHLEEANLPIGDWPPNL
jgi:hypothetical protein